MSSETSTDALQPWQLFTLAGLIGATVVVLVSRGHTPAGIVLLSLIIFAAAVVGLAAWRMLMPFAGNDEPAGPQILGGRTRAALEREKTLVLRSIKELEFDRAMNKISEKDFADMSARLRMRAAGLMRQLDAGAGYRNAIEEEIARRIGGRPPDSPVQTGQVAPPSTLQQAQGRPAHVERDSPPQDRTTANRCAACATDNDADARFCKRCGSRLSHTA